MGLALSLRGECLGTKENWIYWGRIFAGILIIISFFLPWTYCESTGANCSALDYFNGCAPSIAYCMVISTYLIIGLVLAVSIMLLSFYQKRVLIFTSIGLNTVYLVIICFWLREIWTLFQEEMSVAYGFVLTLAAIIIHIIFSVLLVNRVPKPKPLPRVQISATRGA